MLGSEISGKEVVGSQGFKLGVVRDIEFDEQSWLVRSIQVHLEKVVAEEHQLRHRFRKTLVRINVEHVQAVGDKVILKGSKEQLLELIATTPPTEDQKVGSVATEEPANTA